MRMMPDAEVLVIGGGPAGAVCALALSRLGRDVVLCEAAAFPRDHIGICLSPGVISQLDFLGVQHILDHSAHQIGLPIERRWESTSFTPTPIKALLVDRGQFDSDMLAMATANRVRVLQPAMVLSFSRAAEGWVADVGTSTGIRQVRAAFLVDARGRSSGHRDRRRRGTPTVAVHGEWQGEVRRAVRISAADASWTWAAPTGRRKRVAVAFTNPGLLRRMKGSLDERYRSLLEDADAIEPGLELATPPRVCDATPYIAEGDQDGLLRIGDADAALDPLSSSGVQAAIQSALCAGPVINTLLTESADHAAANEYWSYRRISRSETHQTWASHRYAEAYAARRTSFWHSRATASSTATSSSATNPPLPSPGQVLRMSEKVTFVEAPCLVDNLVVRVKSLMHPNIGEPVAYFDGVSLGPMMRALSAGIAASEVVSLWSQSGSPEKAMALLGWCWQHEIAVAV
ncbi:flavin-dependent monooxygenase QhpG [Bradyrhizobium macuxiense]|nr:FAD-dependent monooxygenase [Bradyrhizobium macuxiense]